MVENMMQLLRDGIKPRDYRHTTTSANAEKLNDFYNPLQDNEIERFFEETRNGARTLNLHTTVDKEAA